MIEQPNLIQDSELIAAIQGEKQYQEDHLTLIASENYMSHSLMSLSKDSLVLSNEYAEGYPGKRYYGGCYYADQVESLAIARAKRLFNVEYANVQPHSGSQANAAVFMALLEPGDCFLGMRLDHGGHLTHGAKVNFSGKLYKPIAYGVDATGRIDYDQVEQLAKKHHPKLIIAGCSAYSRIIDWARFRRIADQIGAYLMADIAHIAGLIAAEVHPSPVPFADVITLTTHKTLRGPRGGMILAPDGEFARQKKLNSAVFPGLQGGPLVHVIAAKAAALYEALQPAFRTYQRQIVNNAQKMAHVLQMRGFEIVSGGTDNHLLLVDLTKQNISGKLAESYLEKAHIITNKNTIPGDFRSPFETSGLRLGTPAITSRGFQEPEVEQVAHGIADMLCNLDNTQIQARIKETVLQLCRRFPVYAIYNTH
jgi:glycine hydroxymethyltransferase